MLMPILAVVLVLAVAAGWLGLGLAGRVRQERERAEREHAEAQSWRSRSAAAEDRCAHAEALLSQSEERAQAAERRAIQAEQRLAELLATRSGTPPAEQPFQPTHRPAPVLTAPAWDPALADVPGQALARGIWSGGNGAFRSAGDELLVLLPSGMTSLRLARPRAGGTRLEATVRWEGDGPGDLTLFLDGAPGIRDDSVAWSGYEFKCGGPGRRACAIKRHGQALWEGDGPVPAADGWRRLAAERRGTQLALEIDGRTVMRLDDAGAPAAAQPVTCGLLAWNLRGRITRLAVLPPRDESAPVPPPLPAEAPAKPQVDPAGF